MSCSVWRFLFILFSFIFLNAFGSSLLSIFRSLFIRLGSSNSFLRRFSSSTLMSCELMIDLLELVVSVPEEV